MSANSQESLKVAIENLKEYLSTHPVSLPDLSYTLSQRREHFKWRSFAVLSDPVAVSFAPPVNKPIRKPTIVMVFSGQGAQWPQMGWDLMNSFPEFKDDVVAMDEILQSLGDRAPSWSVVGTSI